MERSEGKVKFEAAIGSLRHLVFVMAVLNVAMFLAGCTSAEVATNSSANSAKSNRNGTSQNTTAANVSTVENSTANTGNNNLTVANNRVQEKIDRMRASASNSVSNTPAAMNSRPAPEDSVMTTQLTDVARETRTFNKHPLLKKVEKTYDSKGASIRVYLRDGRIFDLPGNSITQLPTMPSAAILQLVGISSQAAAPTRGKSKEQETQKKADN